jgi:hypothetical protein
MNPAAEVMRLVQDLRRMSPSRRALLPVPVVGTLVLLLVAGLAGAGLHPVLSAPAVGLAVAATAFPAGSAPLFLVLYLSGFWALTVPDRLGVGVLLASVDLAVVHVAATLSGYGPAGLQLAAPLLRRWGWRLVGMVATAAVVWLVARVFSVVGDGHSTVAVLVGLLAVAGWAVFLLVRLGVPSDSDASSAGVA